jgi:hypothetical protein
MDGGAAQAWFIAGTIPLILAGALHALLALVDTFRPTYFAPNDASVRPAAAGTGIRLRGMFSGSASSTPSMWRVWLGIHITHGIGLVGVGSLCLAIAVDDYALVERIDAVRPLTVAISAAYFAVALRYFFYGPVLITGSATACFTIAAVLS